MEVFGGEQGGVGQVQGNGVFVGGVGEDDGGRWGSERGHPSGDVCLGVENAPVNVVFFFEFRVAVLGGSVWVDGAVVEILCDDLNSVWAYATRQPFVFFFLRFFFVV